MDKVLLVRTWDGYKINLLQLRAGVSACKLRRNVNKNDERTVAMVNELRDTLRGDMFISDFNKEEIEDMIFNLCVEQVFLFIFFNINIWYTNVCNYCIYVCMKINDIYIV